MLLRAVILIIFSFTSNVWSLGAPLKSETGVPVERVLGEETVETICLYGFIDPNSSIKAESLYNCALTEGEGSILELKELNEPDQALPSRITLVDALEVAEGVDESSEQFVRYSDSSQRKARAIHANHLQIFTSNRDKVFSHTFDYASQQAQTYEFPVLPNRVDSFSLIKSSAPVSGQEEDDIHVAPYLIDTSGNFKYWKRAPSELLYEGQWAISDTLSAPEDLDGFIAEAMHPGYVNVADGTNYSGFVVSYNGAEESGLWLNGRQYDGTSFVDLSGQVSSVDISQSKLIKTHKGLAQFYVEERDEGELKVAHLRFIEESAAPTKSLESTDEFHSLESVFSLDGTLYIGHFENGSDLLWHSNVTDEINYSVIPKGMNRLEACHTDRERIFCMMSNFSGNKEQCGVAQECKEGLFLFELIDGEFVKDRTFNHIMLDQGLVSFSGIYAYGKNRFVLIQTVDHKYRLFNLTLAGTFHNKKIDNRNIDIDVSIVPSLTAGSFFLVFASNQSSESIRISANLNADSKAGDDEPADGRDADEDAESEEEDEDKEIPFAEMSSSLNYYFLMMSLFLLFPLRLRK